jgi:hypothetical protein
VTRADDQGSQKLLQLPREATIVLEVLPPDSEYYTTMSSALKSEPITPEMELEIIELLSATTEAQGVREEDPAVQYEYSLVSRRQSKKKGKQKRKKQCLNCQKIIKDFQRLQKMRKLQRMKQNRNQIKMMKNKVNKMLQNKKKGKFPKRKRIRTTTMPICTPFLHIPICTRPPETSATPNATEPVTNATEAATNATTASSSTTAATPSTTTIGGWNSTVSAITNWPPRPTPAPEPVRKETPGPVPEFKQDPVWPFPVKRPTPSPDPVVKGGFVLVPIPEAAGIPWGRGVANGARSGGVLALPSGLARNIMPAMYDSPSCSVPQNSAGVRMRSPGIFPQRAIQQVRNLPRRRNQLFP